MYLKYSMYCMIKNEECSLLVLTAAEAGIWAIMVPLRVRWALGHVA
jgi:hypothetical protein